MMDMMEQFRQTYLEESFEGLDVMEQGLLNLPIGDPDLEDINTIFRAAHSIKGGSGTFGFSEISGFTHVLETLLDELRDGKRQVTQEGVDVMLESVDVLRRMLERLQNHEPIDESVTSATQARLETILNGGASLSAVENHAETVNAGAATAVSGWQISLIPDEDLLQTGNEPLRILRELESLGKLTVEANLDKLPGHAEFQPENLYVDWQLTLEGDIAEDEVREVFEWIDGDGATISIVPQVTEKTDEIGSTEVVQKKEDATAETAVTPSADVATKVKTVNKANVTKSEGSIRVELSKIDHLVNLVGELVITQSMLSQFGEQIEQDANQLESSDWIEKIREGLTHLERHTRELQESVMNIRMLPVSFAFNRMPRIVHDVSQKLGKSIELITEGENTELDKTMLESLTDPLVHVVRNSIDHGIENPDVRRSLGKPETGTVKLAAFHQGGNIVITIDDDGAGINTDKVKNKALERGLIDANVNYSDDEINDLIFHPGFSTADVISDISGRGVGMDVVRRNIRGLGGTVDLHSIRGKGSRFTIRLPLTLAILDGQLANVGGQTYVFPLISIVESIQIDQTQIKGIAGGSELYKLRDEYIPVVKLHEKFGIERDAKDPNKGLLVVVENGGMRAGIFVDDLLGQQQVVIKSLESNFLKIDGIAGATILGDGTVSLILDVGGLFGKNKDVIAATESKVA